jgi:hypothetical protein
MSTINSFIRNIKYGVHNLRYWLPVIWKDRNWDHQFIYDMLHHKMNSMEKSFRHGGFIGHEKEADRIKVCVNLLDRLKKDEYGEMAYKDYYDKWGEPDFNVSDKGICTFIYSKDPNDEDKNERDKDFRSKMHKKEYMMDQDLGMLFDIMKKRIRYWWD